MPPGQHRNHARGAAHGSKTRPASVLRGERAPPAKLREVEVVEIRRLAGLGVPLKEIAALFGVCHSNVWAIVTRRSWRHVE